MEVDVAKARASEQEQALDAYLMSGPRISQFTNLCVRPEDRSAIDPQTEQMLRYRTLLNQEAKEALEERRRREGMTGFGGGDAWWR